LSIRLLSFFQKEIQIPIQTSDWGLLKRTHSILSDVGCQKFVQMESMTSQSKALARKNSK